MLTNKKGELGLTSLLSFLEFLFIVTTSNFSYGKGRVYLLDGDTSTQLWSYTLNSAPGYPPNVEDIDGDGKKELIVGNLNGTLFVFNTETGASQRVQWTYTLPFKALGRGQATHTAAADIDNDGQVEVVVGEIGGGGV